MSGLPAPRVFADVSSFAAPDPRRLRRAAMMIAASCLVPALLDGWQTYMQGQLAGATTTPWAGMTFSAGEWVILGGLTSLVYVLAHRFPPRGPDFRRNIAIHVAGALLLCVGWASMGVLLRVVLGIVPGRLPFSKYVVSWTLTSLPWSVFMYFTVLGCVLAFAYFFEVKEREATEARLSAQVAEARLSALRMQLHPHFLFNSLNAVAVLVRDGRNADATRVVEELSDVLRRVLADGDVREWRVADEIEFLRKYLTIEQVRFSDRLTVEWNIAPAVAHAHVPTFVLQPLVENAVRHGAGAMTAPSTVAISAFGDGDTLVLTVVNAAPEAGAGARAQGRGVGLTNTRERLATLFGDRGRLEIDDRDGLVRATIRLPLVHGE